MESKGGMCEILYINKKAVKDISERMASKENISTMAEIFSLLGNPIQLRIVHALSHGELCVCELSAMLDIERTVLSTHLHLLNGIVRYRKEGPLAYYSLADCHVTALLNECLEHIESGQEYFKASRNDFIQPSS